MPAPGNGDRTPPVDQELVAKIIPLRRRPPLTTEQAESCRREELPLDPLQEERSPEERSVWGQLDSPLPRRDPAERVSGRPVTARRSRRSLVLLTALAGCAALAVVMLVLLPASRRFSNRDAQGKHRVVSQSGQQGTHHKSRAHANRHDQDATGHNRRVSTNSTRQRERKTTAHPRRSLKSTSGSLASDAGDSDAIPASSRSSGASSPPQAGSDASGSKGSQSAARADRAAGDSTRASESAPAQAPEDSAPSEADTRSPATTASSVEAQSQCVPGELGC